MSIPVGRREFLRKAGVVAGVAAASPALLAFGNKASSAGSPPVLLGTPTETGDAHT
jgi:hypothetical protein